MALIVGAPARYLPRRDPASLQFGELALTLDDGATAAEPEFAIWFLHENGDPMQLVRHADRDKALYVFACEFSHRLVSDQQSQPCSSREREGQIQRLIALIDVEWAQRYERKWRALLANNPSWDI